MRKNLKQLGLLLILFCSIFFSSNNRHQISIVEANVPECVSLECGKKIIICHAAGQDGTTHYQTLDISYNAVYGQGGHFYENGTPRAGHENDHLGACTCSELINCPITPTLTPTSIPTSIPTCPPTSTPTSIPTKPEVSNTPTSTPTQIPEVTNTPTPTIIPTPTPTPLPGVGGDDGGSPPGPYICTDAKPGTPSNLTASCVSSTEVKLNWTAASDPHTSYVLAYGPSIGDYRFGSPDMGNGTEYTVKSLTPNTQYCFYIHAQNNCMPGDKSNVVCISCGSSTRTSNILGAVDNYNPLVSGIRDSYGGVILGETTEMPDTAEVKYFEEKLPSGNTIDTTHSIAIPSLNLKENIYIPQKIGDQFTVGHREVLFDEMNGNEVYYGHNGTDVFGNLYRLNKGAEVEVTENGVEKTYQVEEKLFVHKSQVETLDLGDDQIILTTCSYTQPDYRIVIKATIK